MAVVAGAKRLTSVGTEWLAFFAQVLIAISVELGDDLGRTFVSQHGTFIGIKNARNIVAFEAAHGLWVEPSWQMFFQQSHQVLIWTITWFQAARFMNSVYLFCHIFVTLGVGAWVYFYRRRYFSLMRNTIIATNTLALIIYERFPVAPPRLMPPLPFDHHMFTFQDTMYGVLTGGRFVGSALTYNEFSAMPSVHVAWALISAAMVMALARPLLIKGAAVLYPVLMLVAVVVTGNHFVLDAIVALLVVVVAAGLAIAFECFRGRPPWRRQIVAAQPVVA